MDRPDPSLRRVAGVYYTPEEVARGHVRLVQDVLVRELGLPSGFLDKRLAIVDPSVGTGNYLLAVAELAGPGAHQLAQRLVGLELRPDALERARERLVRALGVADLDLRRANTLEVRDPLRDRREHPLMVIIGNPPYGRHGKVTEENRASGGGWVRWGEDGSGQRSLMRDFIQPVREAGQGGQLKNLYNQYVYFMRWALWQALEHPVGDAGLGGGVVSFITAASFLDGQAFGGLRQHMRRQCDEVLVLDLGGEGRGTRTEENVFDVQTPVAIFIAWRRGAVDYDTAARVRYARIRGSRQEKLARLAEIQGLDSLKWRDTVRGWLSPFRPGARGAFATWPTLSDLMPWRCNGVKAGRTWVIAPERETLRRRVAALLEAKGEAGRALFKDSPTGRKYGDTPAQLPPCGEKLCPVGEIRCPEELQLAPLGYRSFDRQVLLADARFLDRASPRLWRAHGPRQLYLSSLSTNPLGPGPALTATALIPDLHHFRGSYGARDQYPLFLDRQGHVPNLAPGMLELLGEAYGQEPSAEEFAAYLYGILAHPAFTAHHAKALLSREVRVPLTRDGGLFFQASSLGRRLLWLHTYGQRFSAEFGRLPGGGGSCLQAPAGPGEPCPDAFHYDAEAREIRVGQGDEAGRFGPVAPAVWALSVSGLQVVRSWLGQRISRRRGRRSSPLDEVGPTAWSRETTDELLRLLSVLEHTLALYPEQASLLSVIQAGALFTARQAMLW